MVNSASSAPLVPDQLAGKQKPTQNCCAIQNWTPNGRAAPNWTPNRGFGPQIAVLDPKSRFWTQNCRVRHSTLDGFFGPQMAEPLQVGPQMALGLSPWWGLSLEVQLAQAARGAPGVTLGTCIPSSAPPNAGTMSLPSHQETFVNGTTHSCQSDSCPSNDRSTAGAVIPRPAALVGVHH